MGNCTVRTFYPDRLIEHWRYVHNMTVPCPNCGRDAPVPEGQAMCHWCLEAKAATERRRAEEGRRRVAHERRERERQWEAILGDRWEMMDWTISNFPAADPVGHAALEAVQPWLRAHTDHQLVGGELVKVRDAVSHTEPGLFVYGPQGAGKTSLGWSCLRARVELRWDGEPEPEYPAFVNVLELLAEAKAAMRDGDGGAVIRKLYRPTLLLLDDLGAERPSEWARDAIAALVAYRHARCLPTITTSNYAPSVLARRLGEGDSRAKSDPMIGKRIVSRLLDNAYTIKLDRPDLRKRAA